MEHDIYITSNISSFDEKDWEIIKEELDKVVNPTWHIDDSLDVFIEEDNDMRHIEAIKYAKHRIWKKENEQRFA